MSYTPSQRERLQLDLAARYEADAYFDDVSVYVLRARGNEGFAQIQSRIDSMLGGLVKKNGKSGAALYVLMPMADNPETDAPGPRLDNIITVRVQELPAINFGPTGTQKSAENIAEKALQIGHHFNPGKGSVLYAAPDCWTPSGAADPKVTIDLKFLQKSGLAQYQKCARVILTPASLVVTLTCPGTAGAIIRYSIDGSYPTLTYTAPLTVPSGTLVRAAAHTVDLQQSDLTELYVT